MAQQQVRKQIQYLEKAHQMIEKLAEQKAPTSETESLVPALLTDFDTFAQRDNQYRQRLRYGLSQYYIRRYQPSGEEITE